MNYLDMLAKLGVGNAHPGGFGETVKQLQKYPIPSGKKVLEVGCGTGRTACYLASQGCSVSAIDIRPEMVVKAKRRAEKLGVQVSFLEGDVCQLPFENNSFDVIMVESVTNFAQADKALSEYERVLMPGGIVYDREVIRVKNMKPEVHQALCDFYGVPALYDLGEWKGMMQSAGFAEVSSSGIHPFPTASMWEDSVQFPDPVHLSDNSSIFDPQIWQLTAQYDQLMNQYHKYLGYTLLIGTKGNK
ncbi:class I SAM-dependent methyltransferase [Paenibacillus hexagrammi]|uniref:Class I SAM-dependent methyltransferase n=1 Tax=Paenibacillus hexagrammi TaxID=2908839 RepID=A0ABY3SEM3_9BACL|nr:class I SAM-dependent methyltransferase [Paenibacillus sp. YPD9-1]UJF32434.1 class I SAM-dependent methyltransferase [Paenibacillus sp. YPD9-1]